MTLPPAPPPLPGDISPPPIGGSPAAPAAFRDAGPLGRLTIALLIVDIAMAIALVGSTLSETRLVDRARTGQNVTFQEAQSNDDRQRGIVLAETLAVVMTGVGWLVWVHRAHTNLDTFGTRELRYTHGWAVGWLLVPFANLVRTPSVMSELARASDPSGGSVEWKSSASPPVVASWWAAYLASVVMREVAAIRRSGNGLDGLIAADKILIAGQLVTVVAGVLAIALVLRIVRAQRARASALGLA